MYIVEENHFSPPPHILKSFFSLFFIYDKFFCASKAHNFSFRGGGVRLKKNREKILNHYCLAKTEIETKIGKKMKKHYCLAKLVRLKQKKGE